LPAASFSSIVDEVAFSVENTISVEAGTFFASAAGAVIEATATGPAGDGGGGGAASPGFHELPPPPVEQAATKVSAAATPAVAATRSAVRLVVVRLRCMSASPLFRPYRSMSTEFQNHRALETRQGKSRLRAVMGRT
jgi:hypothetical protein